MWNRRRDGNVNKEHGDLLKAAVEIYCVGIKRLKFFLKFFLNFTVPFIKWSIKYYRSCT